MTDPVFEFLGRRAIPSLHVELESYRHIRTGARHFHLRSEDDNNCFAVAFPTVPKDSTGVAHILEHTALCGSERFPVRDPFFMMLRRSLNTFMNAFTSSDCTVYPFATKNRKDFYNLLSVYLDAVYFPRLDPLDFAQEGCRVEWQDPADPRSPLVYKGVVYNEMKGAMSSPWERMGQKIRALLYGTTTYHYNSGGEPADIPLLTHAELVAFHRTHYHPSQSILLTYGDLPVAEHQARFEEWALVRFDARPCDLSIGDEQRYTAPVESDTVYPLNPGEETDERTQILWGWLLGRAGEKSSWLDAQFLSGVLLNHSASPLRHYLEITPLACAPSEHCGLDDSCREMGFYCGVEGSDPEHAQALEAAILALFQRLAEEGLPHAQLEPVLMQMELAQREIGGNHYPYGLQLLNRVWTAEFYGGDPGDYLDLDADFIALRERIRDPLYFKGLVRDLLVNNPHRARVTMRPDPTEGVRIQAAEGAALLARAAALSVAERGEIKDRALLLAQRQAEADDPSLLPKVGREDIPLVLRIPEGREGPVAGVPATWFDVGTNGIVHEHLVLDLPALDEEEEGLFPLFVAVATEVGCGGNDYVAQAIRQAEIGAIRASYSVRGAVTDPDQVRGYFSIGGKGLRTYHEKLAALLVDTLFTMGLSEGQRIRELVAQMRAGAEGAVTDQGHSLAMAAAASGMGPMGRLGAEWDGPLGVHRLKALDDGLAQDANLRHLLAVFARLRDKLQTAPRRILVVAEGAHHPALAAEVARTWAGRAVAAAVAPFAPPGDHRAVREGWITNTQVNFCAKAYPAVPADHVDAPVFTVLGRYLQEGYLHRAIREQGGAYGSGASLDGDQGCFRFYSYRDPRLAETLVDFDRSLTWLQESDEPRRLEEAILGVIRSIDQPSSPAGEARAAYFNALQGRTPAYRRRFRDRVLAVDLSALRRVAATYLTADKQSIGVVASPAALGCVKDLDLSITTI